MKNKNTYKNEFQKYDRVQKLVSCKSKSKKVKMLDRNDRCRVASSRKVTCLGHTLFLSDNEDDDCGR